MFLGLIGTPRAGANGGLIDTPGLLAEAQEALRDASDLASGALRGVMASAAELAAAPSPRGTGDGISGGGRASGGAVAGRSSAAGGGLARGGGSGGSGGGVRAGAGLAARLRSTGGGDRAGSRQALTSKLLVTGAAAGLVAFLLRAFASFWAGRGGPLSLSSQVAVALLWVVMLVAVGAPAHLRYL